MDPQQHTTSPVLHPTTPTPSPRCRPRCSPVSTSRFPRARASAYSCWIGMERARARKPRWASRGGRPPGGVDEISAPLLLLSMPDSSTTSSCREEDDW